MKRMKLPAWVVLGLMEITDAEMFGQIGNSSPVLVSIVSVKFTDVTRITGI